MISYTHIDVFILKIYLFSSTLLGVISYCNGKSVMKYVTGPSKQFSSQNILFLSKATIHLKN